MLLRRGVPLTSAFQLTASATSSRFIRLRVERMAAAAEEGASLADALAAGGLLPSSLVWLVDGAQSRGDAAGGVEDVAQIYAQRLDRSVQRMEVLARPAAELLIGAVVFALAYSFIVPLVQTTGDVLGLAKKLF
jgi:general secretion pathway protein F